MEWLTGMHSQQLSLEFKAETLLCKEEKDIGQQRHHCFARRHLVVQQGGVALTVCPLYLGKKKTQNKTLCRGPARREWPHALWSARQAGISPVPRHEEMHRHNFSCLPEQYTPCVTLTSGFDEV